MQKNQKKFNPQGVCTRLTHLTRMRHGIFYDKIPNYSFREYLTRDSIGSTRESPLAKTLRHKLNAINNSNSET